MTYAERKELAKNFRRREDVARRTLSVKTNPGLTKRECLNFIGGFPLVLVALTGVYFSTLLIAHVFAPMYVILLFIVGYRYMRYGDEWI